MSLLDNLPHLCTIQRRKTIADSLGGNRETRIVEYTNVPCWAQKMSASQINLYNKRGMVVTQNIFFTTDYRLTERHEVIITASNGVVIPVIQQTILEVVTNDKPDSTSGLGVLFSYACNERTGQRT